MNGTDRHDDARRTGDALDRIIDEAVEATLRAAPVDLRSPVLAALDEASALPGAEGRRRSWRLRPALLPAVGALLLVAGVAVLWERADRQLSPPRPHAAPSAAARLRPGPSSRPEPAPPRAASAREARPSVPGPARVQAAGARRPAPQDARLRAASFLEMDAAADTARATGASVVLADGANSGERALPGAPAGDLGDPIAPMPGPSPIVIRPISTPPIDVAPPVSTLGTPIGAPTDAAARDPQDPGKPGGM